jgi:histone deacetylase 11
VILCTVLHSAVQNRFKKSNGSLMLKYAFYLIRNLEEALREFHPDILVYNAGTDVLDGDGLGLLAVSEQVSKQY